LKIVVSHDLEKIDTVGSGIFFPNHTGILAVKDLAATPAAEVIDPCTIPCTNLQRSYTRDSVSLYQVERKKRK